MPAEAYTLSTVVEAVRRITECARVPEGSAFGEYWDGMYGARTEFEARQVHKIFANVDWFGRYCRGDFSDAMREAMFDILDEECERIVVKAGKFTRTHVGVI